MHRNDYFPPNLALLLNEGICSQDGGKGQILSLRDSRRSASDNFSCVKVKISINFWIYIFKEFGKLENVRENLEKIKHSEEKDQ